MSLCDPSRLTVVPLVDLQFFCVVYFVLRVSLLHQLLGKLPRCLAPTVLPRYGFADKNLNGKKSVC